jgi:hypothetical protein
VSAIPPLNITVTAKRRACVLDIDLALSRFGLLLAQRLCDEFNVWIVKDLWQILDDHECYFDRSDQPPPPLKGMGPEESRTVLDQWCLARLETDLAGAKIYWVGDAMRESLLPVETDQNLLYRFETLASSLKEPIGEELPGNSNEPAALCAALIPYRGFILTRHNHDGTGSAPAICNYLEERCGIRVQCFDQENTVRMEREWIMPILTRAGVTELLWAGLNLAVVHLVVPNAIFIPPPEREEEVSAFDFPLPNDACRNNPQGKTWWDNSACFWYPL